MAGERLKRCDNILALSQELGMHWQLLYKSQDQLEPIEDGEGPPGNFRERELRQQVSQLKRVLADKTLETIFSKVPCKKSRLDAGTEATLASRHRRTDP
jgi:hypothetical protein